MTPDFHAVELHRFEDGTIRVTIIAELCDQGCGERVRYWNDETGGNASCGCTTEGAESCAEIMMFPQAHALIRDALVEVVADRKRRVECDTKPVIVRVGIDRRRPSARIPLHMGAFDFDVLIELEGGRSVEGEATLVRTMHNTWRPADELDRHNNQAHGWLHGEPMRRLLERLTTEEQEQLVKRLLAAKHGGST